jgi:2,3-bisphosphoglycerate-independent phosphoglycerate mutase
MTPDMERRTTILIILDGWGIGAQNESNPIHVVNPANFSWLSANYPVTSLQASGISVGLPWGEVGNSEVGHLTLGAGKVIYQYYPKVMMAVEDGTFFENPVLKDVCAHARRNNSAVNFLGLLSKANVHASLDHLLALVKFAEKEQVPRIKLHLFADGKDSPPRTIFKFLKLIPRQYLATLIGRYYAMDREERWQITEKAYQCLVGDGGHLVDDPEPMIEELYAKKQTEEYLPPLRLQADGGIAENDAVFFFNYREDSILQLAASFALPEFDKFPRKEFKNLFVATLSRYSEELPCPVAFPADTVEHTLGKVLSDAGKTQMRIAESYKHAHVTFFFNGHREQPYPGEYHVLIPSIETGKPEEHPELRAAAITDRLLEAIQNQAFDFILVNYSNPDTIAHSGNYDACLEAVKVVDREIGRLLKVVLATPTTLIITGDHGNMEEVLSPVTGRIETQHDINPVPFHLVAPQFKGRRFYNSDSLRNETTGILADVAPTILELMGIPKPDEMTGRSLLRDLL